MKALTCSAGLCISIKVSTGLDIKWTLDCPLPMDQVWIDRLMSEGGVLIPSPGAVTSHLLYLAPDCAQIWAAKGRGTLVILLCFCERSNGNTCVFMADKTVYCLDKHHQSNSISSRATKTQRGVDVPELPKHHWSGRFTSCDNTRGDFEEIPTCMDSNMDIKFDLPSFSSGSLVQTPLRPNTRQDWTVGCHKSVRDVSH